MQAACYQHKSCLRSAERALLMRPCPSPQGGMLRTIQLVQQQCHTHLIAPLPRVGCCVPVNNSSGTTQASIHKCAAGRWDPALATRRLATTAAAQPLPRTVKPPRCACAAACAAAASPPRRHTAPPPRAALRGRSLHLRTGGCAARVAVRSGWGKGRGADQPRQTARATLRGAARGGGRAAEEERRACGALRAAPPEARRAVTVGRRAAAAAGN